MPLATATITGAITDLLENGIRSVVTLQPVQDGQPGAIPDSVGNIRRGPRSWNTRRNGELTLTGLPQLPQTGLDDLQWRVTIRPLDRRRRTVQMVVDIVKDTTWAALLTQVATDDQTTPAELLGFRLVSRNNGSAVLTGTGPVTLADLGNGTATLTVPDEVSLADHSNGAAHLAG